MKILVIGGTQFIGRHFAEAAVAAGHDVTLFHRGARGTGIVAGAREILGDRKSELERLSDETWDVAMDSCGYLPGDVRASAQALAGRCGHYLFVSSVSVYADGQVAGDESTELAKIGDPDATEVNAETYGYLKILCERAVQEVFEGRFTIVRPGLVAGPHDPTDRFTYWPVRFAAGGTVPVPDVLKSALQLIDARDLASFMLHALESRVVGVFNAAGPRSTFGHMIETCHALQPNAEIYLVDRAYLQEVGMPLWSAFPLAMAADEDGLMHTISRRAADAGLRYRPLAETARDTLEWSRAELAGRSIKTGLSPEREAELMAGLTS